MTKKRFSALLLAVAMLMSVMGGLASAAIPNLNPGADGYVSLHKTITPTDEDGVFMVTDTIQANIAKPAVFITFVLDSSTSMQRVDIYDDATDTYVDRYTAVKQALAAAFAELQSATTRKNVDTTKIFVNIVSEQASPNSHTASNSSTYGHYEGFVPAFAEDGTTWNTDLEDAAGLSGSGTNTYPTGSYSEMEYGFQSAYESLSKALRKASGDTSVGSWIGGTDRMVDVDIEMAQRFILVLGDGDIGNFGGGTNTSSVRAANYLAASKYPSQYDSDGKLLDSTAMVGAANSIYTQDYALGATVWSSVFGSDGGHYSTWESIFDGSAPPRDWIADFYDPVTHLGAANYWEGTANGNIPNNTLGGLDEDNYRVVEPFMITASADVTTNMPGGYPTGGGYNAATPWPLYAPQLTTNDFREVTDALPAMSQGTNVNYYWVQHINGSVPNDSGTAAAVSTLTNAERLALGSSDGVNVFAKFIQAATTGVTNTANAALSEFYDLYKYRSEPIVAAYTSGKTDPNNTATYTGGLITWNLPELEDGVLYSLVYYVKLKDGLDKSLFYPVSTTTITLDGIVFTWPEAYGSFASGVESDATDATATAASATTTATGYTGADGHQQNRKDSDSTRGYISSNDYNIVPIIKDVRVGAATNGKAKVIVDVENPSYLRFQWQELVDGEWVDVFGATASQYTLSNRFKAGETYTLRCKIINPAGGVTYTAAIDVTATASTRNSEKLNSK